MAPRLRILSLLFVLLAACTAPSSPTPPVQSPTPRATATPASASFPLTLTDDAGRTVTLAAEPRRVVSLAPSNTEIVCAVAACDRLVGVTDYDDYPAQVAGVDKVVTFAKVDVEKVVSEAPDLVLAAGNGLTPPAVIEQLDGLGMTVLVLYPEDLSGVYGDVTLVGRALGSDEEAAALVSSMRGRVAAVEASVAGASQPRTFYEVGVYQGTIYTAAAGSFLESLIRLAGGDPIVGDATTTAIALEDLVVADPELILLGDATYDPTITPETVAARPGWEGMTAVVDDRVEVMTADEVITRPGPRIVDGLEALARAIHPEADN
jgi:cobalamin transport system substrate-binding protein